MNEVARLRNAAFALARDEQFRLAKFIANNVGYDLVPQKHDSELSEGLDEAIGEFIADKPKDIMK